MRYSEQQQRQLDAAGICTVHEPVSAIRLSNGSVTLRGGDSQTECDALYGALGLKVHSELATALGARGDQQGCLWVDGHFQASLEGLYAVGDVAQGLNQINVAAGGAAIAAATMHRQLGQFVGSPAAVTRHRRSPGSAGTPLAANQSGSALGVLAMSHALRLDLRRRGLLLIAGCGNTAKLPVRPASARTRNCRRRTSR